MSALDVFSDDYATARQRFREAASGLGWRLEAIPIDAKGPSGEELTIDVARSEHNRPAKTLVVSSGLHGVEGFFGSAVQINAMQHWADGAAPAVNCLFLHGLNPFGFSWLRRFDENNVDPNRNFLLEGEAYAGSPPRYARLNQLLNPQRPPAWWDPFTLRALIAIARFGMPSLRRAIAAGQYEFPQGLFFGGSEPSQMNQILSENLPRWLQGATEVFHLDFHTGLGPMGLCKLLIDSPLSSSQHARLVEWYGADAFETADDSDIAYEARGGWGPWCVQREVATDYLYSCAEYGTYPPMKMLAGLRAENQSHHWGDLSAASTTTAKQRLKELFCPTAPSWRKGVLDHSLQLVQRAVDGLVEHAG